jgi:hypothetical protein
MATDVLFCHCIPWLKEFHGFEILEKPYHRTAKRWLWRPGDAYHKLLGITVIENKSNLETNKQ